MTPQPENYASFEEYQRAMVWEELRKRANAEFSLEKFSGPWDLLPPEMLSEEARTACETLWRNGCDIVVVPTGHAEYVPKFREGHTRAVAFVPHFASIGSIGTVATEHQNELRRIGVIVDQAPGS